MGTIIENDIHGCIPIFFLMAAGFVILTLPLGVLFTSLSRAWW